jgi:hypothetical protein
VKSERCQCPPPNHSTDLTIRGVIFHILDINLQSAYMYQTSLSSSVIVHIHPPTHQPHRPHHLQAEPRVKPRTRANDLHVTESQPSVSRPV